MTAILILLSFGADRMANGCTTQGRRTEDRWPVLIQREKKGPGKMTAGQSVTRRAVVKNFCELGTMTDSLNLFPSLGCSNS